MRTIIHELMVTKEIKVVNVKIYGIANSFLANLAEMQVERNNANVQGGR